MSDDLPQPIAIGSRVRINAEVKHVARQQGNEGVVVALHQEQPGQFPIEVHIDGFRSSLCFQRQELTQLT